MRRPWNGAMPVLLTLPLGLERRPRVRRKRLRRLAVALIALCVALLAVGYWLPARAWQRTTGDETAPTRMPQSDAHARRLGTLAIGDELTLEQPDGSVHAYEVAGVDVVDSRRAELALEGAENVVVLVSRWPLDDESVPGNWRYVVTARQRF
jgi:hypothetical protein